MNKGRRIFFDEKSKNERATYPKTRRLGMKNARETVERFNHQIVSHANPSQTAKVNQRETGFRKSS
jgi:hypothetical protein